MIRQAEGVHALSLCTQPLEVTFKDHQAPASTPKRGLAPEDQRDFLVTVAGFLTKKGAKGKAHTLLKRVMHLLKKDPSAQKEPSLVFLKTAVAQVTPSFELRKARISGRTQYIPAALPIQKAEGLGLRVLLSHAHKAARTQSGQRKSFAMTLGNEVLQAKAHQGQAIQAKYTTHKTAEHNRTLMRRRWW